MERTPENNSFNNSTAQNPAQNELDLGFNHMEPITPKKAIKSEPSLFDKVADKAKSVLTKKDTGESSQFNTRKEPTFGQPVTQTLPEQAEFLREVERIRKGDSTQQRQTMSGPDFTPSVSYKDAVARAKNMPFPTATGSNAQTQAATQISQQTTATQFSPNATNNQAHDTASTQSISHLQSVSAEITSPQLQTPSIPTFGDTVSAPINVQVNTELPDDTPMQQQTTAEVSDITVTPVQMQTDKKFSDITSVQQQAQAVAEFATEPTTQPQVQTTSGFSDAMSAHTKMETVTGFSDAITTQSQSQSTQGFYDALKIKYAEQTIEGFSHAVSEPLAEQEQAIVIDMPKKAEILQNETVTFPLQKNIDSLITDIAAQVVKEEVKTRTDELLHKVEAPVSKIANNNESIMMPDNRHQVSTDIIIDHISSSQKPLNESAVEEPVVISLEKEINTTMKQKSLQNEEFFDRTSLSEPIPEVSMRQSVVTDLSTEDDFVNEFKTLQAKSANEPISPEDDFLNEFEAIKAKAQTQNEDPVREKKMKNPENWSVMQKLPPKHRRLFIAILGLLVLLIAFFWLKPNSPTVEDFQAQTTNNALPIEFQPLNQNQNIEDHSAPATQESTQQNEAPAQAENQAEQTQSINNVTTDVATTQIDDSENTAVLLLQESTALAQAALQFPGLTKEEIDTTETAENNTTASQNKQPKSATERIKAIEQRASGQQQTPKQQNLSRAEKEKQQREAKKNAQEHNRTNEEDQLAEPISSGRAKTLTVPSGVSLMQVFRDNNLNIADVNAMTKAAGGNVLSNFKPGDKVRVVVNGQGRVNILRLSNGATFVRQANGTYKYHP